MQYNMNNILHTHTNTHTFTDRHFMTRKNSHESLLNIEK